MPAKGRYDKLASETRTQFLHRARHNAMLTIPSLMPLEGTLNQSHLIEPYQGMGAASVIHLSSRLTMGMMPAGRPYMRFDLPPEARMAQGGEQDTATEKGLAMSEQLVHLEVERARWRNSLLMTIQQLLVAGTVTEYVMPDNTIRVFRLDQFVVRRDHGGTILELIIKEQFERDYLPPGVDAKNIPTSTGTGGVSNVDEVELYTVVRLVRERGVLFYRVHQEIGDTVIKDTEQVFEMDSVPYFCHRWSSTPGEDYGRSKVEEHVGDFRSLEGLEKAMLEQAAMAARNFIMVKPGATGGGLKNRLTKAYNGDVVIGDPDSVDLKTFDNSGGYQLTATQVDVIRASLSKAFVLQQMGQRDAERVTATEIERDIQELESALGGNFSALSTDIMAGRTQILVGQMQQAERLPAWPKNSVMPTILTGLEALSRERDIARAMQAGQIASGFGEQAFDVVKIEKILSRAFIGLGFPDAVRTEDEIKELREQRQQQAMMQEMMSKGVGPAVGGVMKAASEQNKEQE